MLVYFKNYIYICGMKDKVIVVFDVANRSFDAYKDVSDAAGHVDIVPTTLSYNIADDGVYYTGSYFVGYGDMHKSKRGGKREKK